MSAEALTQAEIDALLRAGGGAATQEEPVLTPEERDAAGQYANIFRTAAQDVWPKLTGLSITVSLSNLECMTAEQLISRCPEKLLMAHNTHTGDLAGDLLTVLPEAVALELAGAMTGNKAEFGELEQSALGEGLGQLMGTLCTQLGRALKVNTQVTSTQVIPGTNSSESITRPIESLGPRLICSAFKISAGSTGGEILLVLSGEVMDGLLEAVAKARKPERPKVEPNRPSSPAGAETVRPAVFESFDTQPVPGRPGNLDLILDIGLEVRVELGRTAMKIRDVLELGPGAVIELDKLAGEPVDLLVNDKLFARGEVVVIDENFGVRVTDIINLQERIEALKDS